VSEQPFSELSFTSLLLPEPLARGIADAGFERCTPIQAQSLPRALAGFDVAGQAQTGTGKTAAFLVALFLAPADASGRAGAAANSAARAGAGADPRTGHADPQGCRAARAVHRPALALAYGGVDYDKQRTALEAGVDVLIGTPGRIIDYFKQHVFDLRHAQVMVLDEADRMFDLGFIKDIRYLLRRLPPPASASTCCSPRPCRSGCWNSPTST
jgi:ATP-dependent RNA helicase RhlB